MPANTPNLALPYPLAADPANVPSDILALATRLDNLAGSGVFSKAPTQQVLTTPLGSAGTYVTPAGCRAIFVECIGGGASGAGAVATGAGQMSIGGGGGGGGYAALLIPNPVASYSYNIGQGGVAVSGAAGNNGGVTNFGTGPLVQGGGGAVGTLSTAQTPPFAASSGLGGNTLTAGIGAILIPGQSGQSAGAFNTGSGYGGTGGAAGRGGPGGQYAGGSGAGVAGVAPGGGGSGALRPPSAGAIAGGNGANGLIYVTEFY